MDTVGEIAEVWNGLEEVSLDQGDVVELRSARGAGLCAFRVQKHLKHAQRGGNKKEKGELVFFPEWKASKSAEKQGNGPQNMEYLNLVHGHLHYYRTFLLI